MQNLCFAFFTLTFLTPKGSLFLLLNSSLLLWLLTLYSDIDIICFHSALSIVKYLYTLTSCLLLVWSHFWLCLKSHITRHIPSKLTWNTSPIKPVLLLCKLLYPRSWCGRKTAFAKAMLLQRRMHHSTYMHCILSTWPVFSRNISYLILS